jgi:hypothetical protein
MAKKVHQITLSESFEQCQNIFLSDSTSFFDLLDQHMDLDEFIPLEFHKAFYKTLGRKREYPLTGFLSALILQKIFSIPTDSLLLILLVICKELRDFCGFTKIPDAPMLTRFKQDFLTHIQLMFEHMVDYTEPICQSIDSGLSQMLIFDTSGIELYVKENNPKTLNALIKRLKSFYKGNPEVNPYKMAYGLMPSQAASCPHAKHLFINGYFCYADKFSILTNGLGIIRHIAFMDDEFKSSHPEMVVEKKTDSPDEDKSVGDSNALQPILTDFFESHPHFHPTSFLGDSAFDTIETYGFLKTQFHFEKAFIPYNPRNESTLKKVGYNEYGYPVCPNDPNLQMKYHGITREKGRADRIKWGCPKMSFHKNTWTCSCDNPCSTAKRGRTTYTYDNMDFRKFPGVQRDSPEWIDTYKTRGVVEQTIGHLKYNMCIAGRKTRNHQTTKADVYIAAIASLFTVVIAHKLSCPQYIRSLKPLIA